MNTSKQSHFATGYIIVARMRDITASTGGRKRLSTEAHVPRRAKSDNKKTRFALFHLKSESGLSRKTDRPIKLDRLTDSTPSLRGSIDKETVDWFRIAGSFGKSFPKLYPF